ncbi:hypothetical protein ARMGADRAFT_1045754 [Armillaria gallica]|uniref:DUF6570 domain-containing protein n=1 Tax=Armillaria gallica TaxID=47427 RepID=A0A2H3DUA1_ARMGA|nr:hypothetical protein ARMGADRAFT_1045754 [Armillaria gallica]
MISHVISFESPLAKIYDILPPPKKDIDKVLAILFTGPKKSTDDDLKQTPLLVQHNVVFNALSCLSNKVPEGTSVFDMTEANGIDNGIYPIVVHSIVGEQLPMTDIKTLATQHFKNDNGVLAIGHAEHPESIYNNLTLYPSMFPWLFSYGLRGVGLTHLSDTTHKKWLMMYHDKHFQTDVGFSFVAFSHEQIKAILQTEQE